MANITTWTFTGYNMLDFPLPHCRPSRMTSMRPPVSTRRQWLADCHEDRVAERCVGAALLAMLLSIVGTIQLFNEPQIMSTVLIRVFPSRIHR